MTWLVHRTELTVEQERATTLSPREHRGILGSPGSGKTMVLLHRARHLMDEHGISPERLRIFVFTRSLKEYIRSALDLLDLPDDSVMTFDAWCIKCVDTQRPYRASGFGPSIPQSGDSQRSRAADSKRPISQASASRP